MILKKPGKTGPLINVFEPGSELKRHMQTEFGGDEKRKNIKKVWMDLPLSHPEVGHSSHFMIDISYESGWETIILFPEHKFFVL